MSNQKNLEKKKIKDFDVSERPREIMMQNGATYLSDSELLAILIDTGTKEYNAIEIAQNLIKYAGNISNLAKFDVNMMKNVKGIGSAKACKIVASIEFAKRVIKNSYEKEKLSISSPQDIINIFSYEFEALNVEVFKLVCLNVKNHIIYSKNLTVGVADASLITPREVYKEAILRHASSILVMHNHPSKIPTPSNSDIQITKKLFEASKYLDIKFLDHIIYGTNKDYFSFKENNYI